MKKEKTVAEIANMFGVTTQGVRYWLSKGLKHSTERVLGRKERIIIDPEEVKKFLNLTE